MNSRATLYVAGAVSLAALGGLLLLTIAPKTTTPAPPSSAPAHPPEKAAVVTATTTTTTSSAPLAKPSASATAAPIASQPEIDPELDDSWKLLAGNAPPGAGDPFEDETSEPMGRMLGKVGGIRYGVLRKNTSLTNEAAVDAILRRAALDIDRLDRGRSDQPHKRMPEYEAILKKLRDELRPHMSGSVMVAGQGWALATALEDG